MKTYKVAQTYMVTHIYEVDANNQDEAIDKMEKYLYDPSSYLKGIEKWT